MPAVCPFCRGEAELKYHGQGFFPTGHPWTIWCPGCRAMGPPSWRSEEEAVTMWNSRTAPAISDLGVVAMGNLLSAGLLGDAGGRIHICDWCGSRGEDRAAQYGSLRLAHCSKCHHEWQYGAPEEEKEGNL